MELRASPGPARAAALGGLVLLATAALAASGVLLPAERPLRDLLLRLRPARPAAVATLVLVDEESIRRVGAWPWPRETLARLVDRSFDAGARGVVLDLLLPEPREGDAALARALGRGPSVLAAGLDEEGAWLLPASPLASAARVGHVSFDLDTDGVARRFSATREARGRPLSAIAVESARVLAPERPVPVGVSIRPGYRVRPAAVPAVPAWRLLEKGGNALAGRLAIVGASAAGIGDRIVDPVTPWGSPVPGVRVQAAAAEAFLAGDLLRVMPPLLAGLFAGLLAFAALLPRTKPALGLLLALLPLPLGYVGLLLGVETPVVAIALPPAAAVVLASIGEGQRKSREAARATERVAELEAVAAALAEERKDEAEARRVVAHELKTPLTSVRGLAQLLAGYDLSPEERSRVSGLVVAETGRLAAMVDALLDLERLRLKPFRKEARPVDLSGLVSSRVELLGARGRVSGAVEKGVAVLGDARLLERALENLVGNALKFSRDGSPVEVRLSAAQGREALLEVEDGGPGVPAEERTRIFRRFARGETAGGVPGLGLGLSLVAEVAAWHGGRVEVVEPPTGRGSLFRLHLPLAARPER